MEQANDALKTISMVLAICSGVVPIIFGYILYRMSQIFVSKADWLAHNAESDKKLEKIDREREKIESELRKELLRMEEKLDKILEKVYSK